MNQVKIFGIVIVLLIVGVLVMAVTKPVASPSDSGKYDQFAQCLKDSGTIFYGAFWCPHCAAQKKLFGSSQKFLPYVECSLPNAQGQTQICIDAGVESYPTWQFPDGTKQTGEVPLEILSMKSGCALPEGAVEGGVEAGASSEI